MARPSAGCCHSTYQTSYRIPEQLLWCTGTCLFLLRVITARHYRYLIIYSIFKGGVQPHHLRLRNKRRYMPTCTAYPRASAVCHLSNFEQWTI